MSITIVLDSGPLAILTQRMGVPAAEQCRQWMAHRTAQGFGVAVPEIVDYELRRELIRARKTASVQRLDRLINNPLITYLPLTTAQMRLAARLWGDIRNQGTPTAPDTDIDVDVILAAQAMSIGLPKAQIKVATTNTAHLSRLVPADLWQNI